MKALSSKGKLQWAVKVANGEVVLDLEQLNDFIRSPWVLYDFTPAGKKPVRSPAGDWPDFFSDTAEEFREFLKRAAGHYPLTPPKPAKRRVAIFDNKANRYVEREEIQIQTLPTRLMARLDDLVLEHGHLLAHCEAPARMKRGPRPTGARKQKPKGKCGKLFLGKKIGQRYCSLRCAARTAGYRKRARAAKGIK